MDIVKNKIKDSKILVTGEAGFVGSFLTEELVDAGASVVAVDNLSNGRMENLANVKNKM